MLKPILTILGFIVCLVFTCIGCVTNSPILASLSALCSAALGSIISIIITEIDTHGQGLKLWFQKNRYRNKEIRLSISYLFRIQIDGKYLLVRGNRIKTQYQPIGGVYKYYPEAKPFLEGLNFRPDIQMKNDDETNDLRIIIQGKHLLKFMTWFLSMKDREYDPRREFAEELIIPALLPKDQFETLEYRKIYVHNGGIRWSKYLNCDEFLYSDIFELKLSNQQIDLIKLAVRNNPDKLCLATAEELKRECYGGIEKNIGTNAVWLLGE